MKGLLIKDFYMTARYCRAFLLIVAVFIAVSFFGDDNIFFIVYPVMIAGVIPMTLISYDERDKWTQYSGTLPYTRAQLVSSKYLIGLIFGSAAFVLSVAASVSRMLANGYFSLTELSVISAVLLVLGLIGPSLILPFAFKYGAEKGRIAFYIMIGIICAAGVLLSGLGFNAVMPEGPWAPAVTAAAAVLLYAASWRLSVAFYKKREL